MFTIVDYCCWLSDLRERLGSAFGVFYVPRIGFFTNCKARDDQSSWWRIETGRHRMTRSDLVGSLEHVFIFHNINNIWDNPSYWLIFFKMVETTNQWFVSYHWPHNFLRWPCSCKLVCKSEVLYILYVCIYTYIKYVNITMYIYIYIRQNTNIYIYIWPKVKEVKKWQDVFWEYLLGSIDSIWFQ